MRPVSHLVRRAVRGLVVGFGRFWQGWERPESIDVISVRGAQLAIRRAYSERARIYGPQWKIALKAAEDRPLPKMVTGRDWREQRNRRAQGAIAAVSIAFDDLTYARILGFPPDDPEVERIKDRALRAVKYNLERHAAGE